MRIDITGRTGDRVQQAWFKWTAIVCVLSGIAYYFYAHFSRNGPSGSSKIGLACGGLGYGFIVYAALLSVRKNAPKWINKAVLHLQGGFSARKLSKLRLRPVRTWMLRHLWLGFLSYPLILFHAGGSFGKGLTLILMWVLSLVFVSGLLGALLQHLVPKKMTERVPNETIYGEIGCLQKQLAEKAGGLLKRLRDSNDLYGLPAQPSNKPTPHRTTTLLIRIDRQAGAELRKTYAETIQPFLDQKSGWHSLLHRHPLSDAKLADRVFANLRASLPQPVHPDINALEGICTEKRDFNRQTHLHWLMYWWQLVHVPLSVFLIVAGFFHAVRALFYD